MRASIVAPLASSQQVQISKYKKGHGPITLARALILPTSCSDREVNDLGTMLSLRHPSLVAGIQRNSTTQQFVQARIPFEVAEFTSSVEARAAALNAVSETRFSESQLSDHKGSAIRLYRSPVELIFALYASHALVDGYGMTNAVKTVAMLAAQPSHDLIIDEARELSLFYSAKQRVLARARTVPVTHWEASFDGYENIPTQKNDELFVGEALQFETVISSSQLKALNDVAFRRKTGLSLILMNVFAKSLAGALDRQRICIRSITHNRRDARSRQIAGYLCEDFGMFFDGLLDDDLIPSVEKHSDRYLRSISHAESYRVYDPPDIRTTDIQYRYSRNRTLGERSLYKSIYLKKRSTVISHKFNLTAAETGEGLSLTLGVNPRYYSDATAEEIWSVFRGYLKEVRQG